MEPPEKTNEPTSKNDSTETIESRQKNSSSHNSQEKKQPLLTWPSFLISAVIILCIYMIASAFTGDSKKEKQETHTSGGKDYTYTVVDGEEDADTSILAIPVRGIILTEQSSDVGFFNFLSEEGVVYGYEVKEQLKRAAKDDSIKGVVLEINSPGGTIPGAVAISEGVAYYREVTGNPVYAHIADMGASGGYWAAASTEYIVSDPGSAIGSIGVILGPFTQYNNVIAESNFLGGVETEGGIDYRFFTGGQYKDSGSPYRPLTPEEERHWQTSVDNEYRSFVSFVSARRNISPEFLVNTVKALAYEPQRAIELKLIDEIGSKESTYNKLAMETQLEDYNIVSEEEDFGILSELFKGATSVFPALKAQQQAKACNWCNGPLVLYDRSYTIGK